MTTHTNAHNAWTRANGERPASTRRVRDSLDAKVYGHTSRRPHPRLRPGPVQVVVCDCGEQTIARSPNAPTLTGWTVEAWPEQPQEYGKVTGVCRKCAKAHVEVTA